MRIIFLTISISQLITFAFAGECITTGKSNCYNNIGDPCTLIVDVGKDICCWTDGTNSGVVVCDETGVFKSVTCGQQTKCQTDFKTCKHKCL